MTVHGSMRIVFLARHATISIGVETLEHVGAHRVELAAGDLTVGVRVATAALSMPAPLRPLLLRNHTVTIGVEPCEHLVRMRKELLARDLTVIIGVSALEMLAMTAAPMASLVLSVACAPFFASHLPVVIGVHLPEVLRTMRVKLLSRHRTVIVGVGALEHAPRAVLPVFLRSGQSSHRQRGHAGRDKHCFSHTKTPLRRNNGDSEDLEAERVAVSSGWRQSVSSGSAIRYWTDALRRRRARLPHQAHKFASRQSLILIFIVISGARADLSLELGASDGVVDVAVEVQTERTELTAAQHHIGPILELDRLQLAIAIGVGADEFASDASFELGVGDGKIAVCVEAHEHERIGRQQSTDRFVECDAAAGACRQGGGRTRPSQKLQLHSVPLF